MAEGGHTFRKKQRGHTFFIPGSPLPPVWHLSRPLRAGVFVAADHLWPHLLPSCFTSCFAPLLLVFPLEQFFIAHYPKPTLPCSFLRSHGSPAWPDVPAGRAEQAQRSEGVYSKSPANKDWVWNLNPSTWAPLSSLELKSAGAAGESGGPGPQPQPSQGPPIPGVSP